MFWVLGVALGGLHNMRLNPKFSKIMAYAPVSGMNIFPPDQGIRESLRVSRISPEQPKDITSHRFASRSETGFRLLRIFSATATRSGWIPVSESCVPSIRDWVAGFPHGRHDLENKGVTNQAFRQRVIKLSEASVKVG